MPIEHGRGGTTVTGDSIDFLQLVAQRGAVKLEKAGIGVRRGRKLWPALAQHYNIPGQGRKKPTIDDVLAWLTAKVEELRPQQEHRHVENGREVRTVNGQEVQ